MRKTQPKRYEQVEKEMIKSGGDRMYPMHGKLVKLRGHSLSPSRRQAILDEWKLTGKFVSPYSVGTRTDHLMALAKLGENKPWLLKDVKEVLQKRMSARMVWGKNDTVFLTAWERFEKNNRAHQSTSGRIIDNFRSFRRLCLRGGLNPYGHRLEQIGCCVDIFMVRHPDQNETSVEYYFRLNTHSTQPLLMVVQDKNSIPKVDLSVPEARDE